MNDFGFKTNSIDGISQDMIDAIIDASIEVQVSKSGGNNKCKIVNYNGQDYAVLKTTNIECYNLSRPSSKNKNMSKEDIMDTGEFNFDEVMRIGASLKDNHVVPVLGFSWDTQKVGEYGDCAYARGFIVQPKAPGRELYDGVRYMHEYKAEEVAVLIDYTKKYAKIPPKHFADFVTNYIAISQDLAIDPSKRGNFFYDEQTGFHFIDLNFHQDLNKTQDEITAEAVRYSIGQFRTIYDGLFKTFPENEQVEYATASKEIFENIIKGYTMAGIDKAMLIEALDEQTKDNGVFESVGVTSTEQFVEDTLAKAQQEDKVQ